MDELADTGAFEDALTDEGELDRELREMRSTSEVETELDTLRAEMGKETEAEADSEHVAETDSNSSSRSATDEDVEAEIEQLEEEDQ
jgi:phage shock protein A